MAIARELGRANHRLAISYRSNDENAEHVSAEMTDSGVEHAVFKADLSDSEQACRLPKQVVERLGGIDALINNAGTTDDASFLTMEPHRYRKLLKTNLFSAINVTGAALPYLLKAQNPAVVMVTSLGGIVGKEGQVAYASSKGGLIGFTQWLGRRYRREGLSVNAVAPGFIQTELIEDLSPKMLDHMIEGTALHRVGSPEEVAKVVHFLLSPGYIQSTTLRVDGGFNR